VVLDESRSLYFRKKKEKERKKNIKNRGRFNDSRFAQVMDRGFRQSKIKSFIFS
jgi:hypothetical protein